MKMGLHTISAEYAKVLADMQRFEESIDAYERGEALTEAQKLDVAIMQRIEQKKEHSKQILRDNS